METSSRCNLACAKCVKQGSGASCAEGDLSEEVFDALLPAFPRLESLILNGVGEPLLHRGLDDFVRKARAAMPESGRIGFQSNGLLLDGSRARSLLVAGLDRLALSVDALDPGLFGELRSGGSLAAVERAFAALRAAKTELGRPGFAIGAEIVIQRSNLGELPRVVEWAASKGASFLLVSHLLPYDRESAAEAAYELNLDLALELRERWRGRGLERGVDILDYPSIYMKYEKTPAETLIVGLVGELQAEALAAGITVNVGRLLAAEPSLVERVRESFEAAERIARREGLELSLPSTAPRRARSCDFVEGGTAFVSWEGGVHPCYFLWHRYACYLGGLEKRVAPKVFGRLPEGGILDIWNDPDFTVFRDRVGRYDYPYCYNCNLALCDYVQLEDSGQDCHINAEPCAACMWCLGVFRCMT